MDSIKAEDIIQYYHGKANRCHCGCAGNYVEQNNKNKWRFEKILILFKNIDPESIKMISHHENTKLKISFHTTIGDKDYDFWLNPRKS